jgi:dipeptidyl aminopeptidase/acylaminoacyl peptidase
MRRQFGPTSRTIFKICLTALFLSTLFTAKAEMKGMDFDQLAAVRRVTEARISSDGSLAAYVLSVPRSEDHDDGPEWSELHVIPTAGGESRPYVHGEVNVSNIRFMPGGAMITYIAKRGKDEQSSLWTIPIAGGESRKLIGFETDITDYALSPDGERLAFLANEPVGEKRKNAIEKGYTQEVFEEDWSPRKLWIATLEHECSVASEPEAMDIDGSVLDLEWAPDGKRIALAVAPRPLVDDSYMLRRIKVYDVESGELLAALNNPGKLGHFAFSPDGRNIAMISAADPSDPAEGRLLAAPAAGGELRDLLPALGGHVNSFAWKDDDTLMAVAEIGVETEYVAARLLPGKGDVNLRSGDGIPVFGDLRLSRGGKLALFIADSPLHPGELFVFDRESGIRRLTHSNSWLSDTALAKQEVIEWKARDGMELQGMLIRPLHDDGLGAPPPLIVVVHGGPESHYRNGWLTYYSRPGQLAAGRGYAVFYPNYRGGTGRGVAHSKLGQSDAAGKEFDDILDAIDHLVATGIADGERVGVIGGSYGGYATAWFATRHTDRFRAAVMFVGISNKLTKGFTTDIPIEDVMVHTRFQPWEKWSFSLERSPLYHIEQARTPILIAGGTSDTRVHPSQSLQLYRGLKLLGKVPVRYVRYPGEGHGNRRRAARDDYSRRLMRWFDHFLVDGAKDLPPWALGTAENEEAGDS